MCQCPSTSTSVCAGVFHGRLLPADLARPEAALRRPSKGNGRPHQNVRAYMEARHLLLQRAGVVPSHHHHAQQTTADQAGWYRALLNEVKWIDLSTSPLQPFTPLPPQPLNPFTPHPWPLIGSPLSLIGQRQTSGLPLALDVIPVLSHGVCLFFLPTKAICFSVIFQVGGYRCKEHPSIILLFVLSTI